MPPAFPALDAYDRAPRRVRLGVGAALVLMLLALGGTVLMGVVRGADGGTVVEASTQQVEDRIFVHVAGAVRDPGMYRLGLDARVVDAVAAAGGFVDEADRAGVNLARPVVDGEQLLVPVQAAAGAPGAVDDGLVHLNTADAAALEELPRIGPALAQRILDWRDAHGPFTSVDELRGVSGIGEKLLATLRPLVAL